MITFTPTDLHTAATTSPERKLTISDEGWFSAQRIARQLFLARDNVAEIFDNSSSLRTEARLLAALLAPTPAEAARTLAGVCELRLQLAAQLVMGTANDVPFASLVTLVEALRAGLTQAEAAELAGVNHKVVSRAERIFGIGQAVRDQRMDDVLMMLREGATVDELSEDLELSPSTARRLARAGRSVLQELEGWTV